MKPEKISILASLVLERLNEKRIGFLWPAAPVFLERRKGFRWIHYCRRDFLPAEPAPRGQSVFLLEDGQILGLLDMLVVPAGNAGVLCETASGMTVSPESSLIDGALRASIPVLFDVSPFDAWLRSSMSKRVRACDRVLKTLSGRGMEFIGLSEVPSSREDGHQVFVDMNADVGVGAAPGTWFSWTEIAPFVRGPALRLARGARLTPEASDRLAQLNVRVEEVF
jgi:hypothetical protein